MINKIDRKEAKLKRQKRVRAKVTGTATKPRLCVFKSLTNLYVQAIDDTSNSTIMSVSTLDKEITVKASNIEAAKEVGTEIAKKLLKKKIKTVVFDRNGYLYHGKVKALADAAREAGLEF